LFLNIGAVRAISTPGFAKNLFIPYTNALKKGKLIHANVTEIGDKTVKAVLLDNSDQEQEFPYDYLVLATGTAYSFPLKVKYLLQVYT
jgi:NADH dehydrogenase FAD-containing subunit